LGTGAWVEDVAKHGRIAINGATSALENSAVATLPGRVLPINNAEPVLSELKTTSRRKSVDIFEALYGTNAWREAPGIGGRKRLSGDTGAAGPRYLDHRMPPRD
jgi:hypothetical protein